MSAPGAAFEKYHLTTYAQQVLHDPALQTLFDGTLTTGVRLTVKAADQNIGWVLQANGSVVGAGQLIGNPPSVASAVIKRGWRRKGLYTQTLKKIREVYGSPIMSGRSRSKGATKVWKKLKAEELPGEGKYRLNPSAKPFAAFVVAFLEGGVAATTRAADRGEEGRIGLPGGKIDPGETAQQAAVREAKEEGWEVLSPLKEVHRDMVEGKLVVWFLATKVKKKARFKEKGRIKPLVVSLERIIASGYGNEWLSCLLDRKNPPHPHLFFVPALTFKIKPAANVFITDWKITPYKSLSAARKAAMRDMKVLAVHKTPAAAKKAAERVVKEYEKAFSEIKGTPRQVRRLSMSLAEALRGELAVAGEEFILVRRGQVYGANKTYAHGKPGLIAEGTYLAGVMGKGF